MFKINSNCSKAELKDMINGVDSDGRWVEAYQCSII